MSTEIGSVKMMRINIEVWLNGRVKLICLISKTMEGWYRLKGRKGIDAIRMRWFFLGCITYRLKFTIARMNH